jgi:hypothetical protein
MVGNHSAYSAVQRFRPPFGVEWLFGHLLSQKATKISEIGGFLKEKISKSHGRKNAWKSMGEITRHGLISDQIRAISCTP